MKIAVCVKRVPDTGTRIRIADDGRSLSSDGVKFVLNPYDEFAVEAALQLAEAGVADSVTLLALGPDEAKETLRHGLALGAHDAVLLRGETTMDGWATAQALAAELARREDGLVLFGAKAVDDDQQQVGPMVAGVLGRPCVTSITEIEVADSVATCRRSVEGGQEVVEVDLPAVATVTKGRYEPRYASLRGIMMAKRKPIADKEAAHFAPGLVVEAIEYPPERQPGRIVGSGVEAVGELVRLLREEEGVV